MKAVPWYHVSDTSIPLEDLAAITDYLTLGGTFTDVATPIMFIKKLLSSENYKLFCVAITKAERMAYQTMLPLLWIHCAWPIWTGQCASLYILVKSVTVCKEKEHDGFKRRECDGFYTGYLV